MKLGHRQPELILVSSCLVVISCYFGMPGFASGFRYFTSCLCVFPACVITCPALITFTCPSLPLLLCLCAAFCLLPVHLASLVKCSNLNFLCFPCGIRLCFCEMTQPLSWVFGNLCFCGLIICLPKFVASKDFLFNYP